MQQQQQQEGGESGYGGAPSTTHMDMTPIHTQQQLKLGDPSFGIAEEASPISSRPPALLHPHSSAANFEDSMDAPYAGGDEADRGGGGGGNRWPRQETLALLKIRSDMDAVFRDASLKGPLWEDVSRKLAELGYKRSAKKCKEKFENVHKYYKRTKEGRAGRQDGKSYRFFSQLEALAATNVPQPPPPAPTTHLMSTPPLPGIGITANPIPPISTTISFLSPPVSASAPAQPPPAQPPPSTTTIVFSTAPPPSVPPPAVGISFSSDSTSSSSSFAEMDEEDEEEATAMEVEGDPARTGPHRKRKRESSKRGSSRRMMEFFEGLMKQVMQKQEAMQQRFLETIEKREQDRMIREEAWKRQEMARLAREHELMAQERAMSSSRDTAIISFLQKITGQTIQFPPPVTIPAAPPPQPQPPQPQVIVSPSPPPPPQPSQQHQNTQQQQQQLQHLQQQQQIHHQQQHTQPQSVQPVKRQESTPSEVVVAVPERQLPPAAQPHPHEMGEFGSTESASSSRWPKAEVLALIELRSGLESRYQEAVPKGPLWEEISAGMQRMGYRRNAKRCKEKWENINKYYKKVKESNKKRPEDAKTCPYFHQLDALYRKKIIGSTTSTSTVIGANQHLPEEQQQQQQQQQEMTVMPSSQTTDQPENKSSDGDLTARLFGEGSCTDAADTGANQPEDIMKEQNLKQQTQQLLMMDLDDKARQIDSEEDEGDDEEDEYDDNDDNDLEDEEAMKMSYKIEFQRQSTAPSTNGEGNGTPSFMAMVQ